MIKSYRAWIIGSGFAARFHYEALLRVFGTKEELSAYARNKKKHSEATIERGLKIYDTLEYLIEDSDVVHLCTSPSTHESLTLQVLTKNKRVIMDKYFTGYFGYGLKNGYIDIENGENDHLEDEDVTIAEITASELLQAGVKNSLVIHANNHRIICNISPI